MKPWTELVARLACALLLVGCGGDDGVERAPSGWTRLSLRPVDAGAPAPAAPAERRVPLAVGPEAPGCRLLAGTWDSEGRVRPDAQGDAIVQLDATLRPGEVHALRLLAASTGGSQVIVEPLRRGIPLAGLGPFPLAAGATPEALDVMLPARLSGFEADALRLRLRADAPVALAALGLVTYATGALLPDAGRPALVRLGEDARRAVGLLAGAGLGTSLPGDAAGTLRFAVGRPEPLRVPGAVLRVLVDGRELGAFALDDPRDGDARWTGHALDVPAGAARALRLVLDAPADAGCALAEAAFVPDAPPAASHRVLLVTTDTHRGDHLGAARSAVDVPTPNLDALAARGTLFTDCFASANFTNPSHAALMTGTSPQVTGILRNDRALAAEAPTLAERFAEAGYRTLAVLSAHHLGDAVSGLGQGFDRVAWPDAAQRPSGSSLDVLVPWLDEARDDGRPLFVWLHVFDAHLPYVPRPEFDRLGYDGPDDPFDPARPALDFDASLPAGLRGLRDVEWARAQYRGCVASLDLELARAFDHPALDDALVAVVGDHGESLGAHDIWFSHAGLYPDTLHVPLVLAGPGVPGARVDARPVRQVDLGRTLLDLCGLGEVEFPGRSLLRPAPDDDGARFALASHATSASITLDGLHLEMQLVDHHQRWRAHAVELYDLATDPGCTRDLTDERPDVARALRARLVAWLSAAGRGRWAGERDDDAALRERLAALGYVDGGDESDAPFFVEDDCEECRRFR